MFFYSAKSVISRYSTIAYSGWCHPVTDSFISSYFLDFVNIIINAQIQVALIEHSRRDG